VAGEKSVDVARAAEERQAQIHGPVSYAEPSPIKESLFVLDPTANTLELSVRRESDKRKTAGQNRADAPNKPRAVEVTTWRRESLVS